MHSTLAPPPNQFPSRRSPRVLVAVQEDQQPALNHILRSLQITAHFVGDSEACIETYTNSAPGDFDAILLGQLEQPTGPVAILNHLRAWRRWSPKVNRPGIWGGHVHVAGLFEPGLSQLAALEAAGLQENFNLNTITGLSTLHGSLVVLCGGSSPPATPLQRAQEMVARDSEPLRQALTEEDESVGNAFVPPVSFLSQMQGALKGRRRGAHGSAAGGGAGYASRSAAALSRTQIERALSDDVHTPPTSTLATPKIGKEPTSAKLSDWSPALWSRQLSDEDGDPTTSPQLVTYPGGTVGQQGGPMASAQQSRLDHLNQRLLKAASSPVPARSPNHHGHQAAIRAAQAGGHSSLAAEKAADKASDKAPTMTIEMPHPKAQNRFSSSPNLRGRIKLGNKMEPSEPGSGSPGGRETEGEGGRNSEGVDSVLQILINSSSPPSANPSASPSIPSPTPPMPPRPLAAPKPPPMELEVEAPLHSSTQHTDSVSTTEHGQLEMPPPAARPKPTKEHTLAPVKSPKKSLLTTAKSPLATQKSPKQRSRARGSSTGLDQELRFSRYVHVLVVEDNAVNAKFVSKVAFYRLFFARVSFCLFPPFCTCVLPSFAAFVWHWLSVIFPLCVVLTNIQLESTSAPHKAKTRSTTTPFISLL
jgi:hypothetical protein